MTGAIETEVKLAVQDRDDTAKRLTDAGFRVSREREFESNTLYDTADQQLRNKQMLLRLRRAGSRGILTWKGPGDRGRHKSRPERETSVGSIETLAEILHQIGYQCVFKYEKYRTEFKRSGEEGAAVLDETPIGNFLELEGPAEWIDATSVQLGFKHSDYILDSYGALYQKWSEHRDVQPKAMVFSS
jgi:adenylate cyclase, class 2